MTLTTEKNGTELTVRLAGELNAKTVPELTALLSKEIGSVKNLTLDFAECDYVSSAGLRVLLAAYKQMKAAKGEMHLKNVGENFMDVLMNSGLFAVFDLQ
jgi:anti-sigma B factor antagonist